jgi:hypothetical protein
VKAFRAVVAVLLVLLGCWCLMWRLVFIALTLLGAEGHNPFTDYLKLAAWVPASWIAAYFVQPWWRYRGRQRPGETGA